MLTLFSQKRNNKMMPYIKSNFTIDDLNKRHMFEYSNNVQQNDRQNAHYM